MALMILFVIELCMNYSQRTEHTRSDSVFPPSVIYLILMSTIDYIQTKSNKP